MNESIKDIIERAAELEREIYGYSSLIGEEEKDGGKQNEE